MSLFKAARASLPLGRALMVFALLASTAVAEKAYSASLTVIGSETATNSGLRQDSVIGPVTIRREGVEQNFGNNRIYTNIAGFTAFADYGVNKVTGFASTQGRSVVGGASSQWSDSLTLTTPNSVGFLNVLIDLAADIDVMIGGGGSSNYRYELSHFTSRAFGTPYREYGNVSAFGYDFTESGFSSVQTIRSGPSSRRLITVKIPYLSGQSLTITSNLSCNAASGTISGNNNAQIATCDAGRSAYWGGIVDVTDVAGNLISNWTLDSISGTNYRQSFIPVNSVPEPSTWAMLVIGFGLAGGMIRRRPFKQAVA